MANEIVYSGIGDLTVAAALSNQVLLMLADRAALPNHPALFDAGAVALCSATHSWLASIPAQLSAP